MLLFSPQETALKIVQLTTDNREPFREYTKPEPWFGAAPEALLQGFAATPGVEVHVIGCTQQPMVSSPAKLAENIWFHSVHVPKLGWMRTAYAGCILATRKKIAEIRPDVVHGQGTERDCALGAVFSGFPNVLTIHGNMAELARLYQAPLASFSWLTARLEDFALPRANGVLCNSAYTQALVAPRARTVWPVPNAIREEFLQKPVPRQSGPPVLLNVGVISRRKRQIELLEWARKLIRQGERFELWFVGRMDAASKYAGRFREQLRAAESEGFARHLGNLNLRQLVRLFDEVGGVIHLPEEEAFGLVVAEALARNLKFFGASIGGIKDIASGVEGAELFPFEDWDALTQSVRTWLRAGCPLPLRTHEQMRERYAPELIALRHLEIYREVLARS